MLMDANIRLNDKIDHAKCPFHLVASQSCEDVGPCY